MNVPGVSALFVGSHAAAATGLSIPGGDDFAGKLQLGQIIKGRVLRHYEGSRYAVSFDGREKVVDSAVPLQTGDVLYGKVVGLGERVELERVRGGGQPAARENAPAPESKFWNLGDSASKLIADVAEQYQARLTLEQTALIEQSVRAAGDQRLMALSGLMLSKLGMGMTPEWLKAIYDLLRTGPNRGLFALNGKALELEVSGMAPDAVRGAASESPVPALAELLRQLMEQPVEKDLGDGGAAAAFDAHPDSADSQGGQGGQAGNDHDLGRWLMNAQTGGSVAHRTNTIPLLVNGRLLELNVAVFEQREGQHSMDGARHRQLSFSLHSEQLGHVQAKLLLTGEHIKMTLGSDREATSEWLAAYSPELMRQLADDGWHVDQLNYETKPAQAAGVARAVLQHVVSQDSISRLI